MTTSQLGSVVTADGVRIWFDPDDRRGSALARSAGDVNPASTRLWRTATALSAFRCVVDVGSNYGEMLAATDLSEVDTVLAYEPNAAILPALRRTARELDERIRVRPVALGAVPDASVHFVPHPNWSGKSRVATDAPAGSSVVSSTTLDEELRETPESLVVKIDVEGAELAVIAGMHRVMEESDLVVIMLEILHMSVQQVSEMTRRWPTYVLDERDGSLVRLPTNDPLATGVLLHEGNLHRENALLIAGRDAARFIAARASLQRTAGSALRRTIAESRAAVRAKDREITRLRATLSRRSVRAALAAAELVPGWVRRPFQRDR